MTRDVNARESPTARFSDRPASGWVDQEVRLVAYDHTWPVRFEAEAALLEGAIVAWVTGGIHHVGSTAMPGMTAKPIIDILVGVADLRTSLPCVELLEPLGYVYAPYLPEVMHWFCKPDPARRTHHLHLVPTDSGRYRDELDFRDTLRADPATAQAYAELKQDLAQRFRQDREAYTAGKTGFVAEVLGRAVGDDSVFGGA